MISLQLEWMSGNSYAVQLNCNPIAIFLLWAMQLEISPPPQQFDKSSCATQCLFLKIWDQIHLANPGPTVIYLDLLLSSINVNRDQVMGCPGSGQVARAASMCLLRTLSGAGMTLAIARGIHQRYLEVIPPAASFEGLVCCYTMNVIHSLLISSKGCWSFRWTGYKPCAQEHIFIAATLVQVTYTTKLCGKVPCWVLRFVIDSLSQNPPPPTSVILNCLTIIAIDLNCDLSNVRTVALDERYV